MDAKSLAAAGLGAMLLGVSAPPARPDPATAAALDPVRMMSTICGGGRAAGAAHRVRLTQASALTAPSSATDIQRIAGLGPTRMKITTKSPEAQAWFDQGLVLAWGFNHDAAIRSFRKAQAADPGCAMCFWGEAWARGPNINAAMEADETPDAVAAARRAQALAGSATPLEQTMIAAVNRRYSPDPKADRAALDQAYARAMREVAERFPRDDEAQLTAAEAVMDTQPWDYWESDQRTPRGEAGWAIAAVERVLARNPDHPQAEHLYIHLVEASATPQRAEAAADRLNASQTSGAGHLVHMPAHIYYRVGRFKDSYAANVRAARTDEAFLRSNPGSAMYRYGYYPHNVHFLVVSAQMAGERDVALAEATRLRGLLDVETAKKAPWVEAIWAAPYFAHAQFSAPKEILAQPAPDPSLPYVVGMWRYSRAVAEALRGDGAGVERELTALRQIRDRSDFSAMDAGGFPARKLLSLAEQVALGRLAAQKADWPGAVAHYRAARALEAETPYQEPPYWYFPVGQSLGAALLRSGQPEEARKAFLQTLTAQPDNGWALYGLAETQAVLGDRAAEEATRAALARTWRGDPKWLRLERL